MIGRRGLLAALLAAPALLPSLLYGQTPMALTAQSTAEDISALLSATLIGQPLDSVAPMLGGLGARGVVMTDIAAMDLPRGTPVAEGIAAGDRVMLALFGLRRGLLRPDRRVQVALAYDAARRVSAVGGVTLIAK